MRWILDYLETEILHSVTNKSRINPQSDFIHSGGSSHILSPHPSTCVVFVWAKYVANKFYETTFRIAISGLDPALPLYTFQSKNQRLCPSDAAFVDIIHTDGGVLGLPFPMGHADFFPNGGVGLQPGCVEQQLQKQQWLGVFSECSWPLYLIFLHFGKCILDRY